MLYSFNEGSIKLYQGDANKLIKRVPDASVDLIVCDPSYGVNYASGRAITEERKKINVSLQSDEAVGADWLQDSVRVLREGSALYMFTRWDVSCQWQGELEKAGLRVKNVICWIKSNHTAGDLKGNYAYRHEFILFATKGRHIPYWDKRQTNVWEEKSITSTEPRVHPTQKPLGIVMRCIMNSCPEGGRILDPFAGSGTTLIAAGLLGFGAVGFEIEPQWIDAAVKRLETEL